MLDEVYLQHQKDLDFIRDYVSAINSASGSKVDANSNVSNKNIATMAPEIHKQDNMYANRLAMHHKITKLYGEELADEYIRQLENHEIYRHDETGTPVGTPYCVSITMYPFLLDGLKQLGGTSLAPKNLDSFCGSFVNLVFAVAAQFAGAVATPEFLAYFTYFCIKEYGKNFHERVDEVVDNGLHKRTLRQTIEAKFQQIVYSLNQPAAARGSQSVFWNIAYFDEPYFRSLFESFYFPDGTFMLDIWEEVKWIQKFFMKWFNAEREKDILTFPVESFSLLNDGMNDYVDQEAFDWCAQMLSEGHSFFIYNSDSVDSLASCCFSKDTKVLWRTSYDGVHLTSFEELYNLKHEPYKKNFTVFHNGFWVKAKPIKLPNRKMYRVLTANHKEYILTDNHVNVTDRGNVPTVALTTNDYLAFNTNALSAIPETDERLTYEQGVIVGTFLGDGSFGYRSKDGTVYEINFSLNREKYDLLKDHLETAIEQMGLQCEIATRKMYNNVLPVVIFSKELAAFIQKWTNWTTGTKSYNKEINLNCLTQSYSFRKGILDGWYATDGGNSNRCYTSSAKLAECMEALLTSLGLNSIIDVSDRTNEPVVIRGNEYNRNYPLYCVRWYGACQRKTQSGVYKWANNTQYFKITSIKEVDYNDDVYCFEMKNALDPYFTLPSGLITHNCRLRNELQDNTFSYSLGAGGISTGSKCVMTINVNRLVQDAVKNGVDIGDAMRTQVDKVHKYLNAFNEIVKDMFDNKMLQVYDAGFIAMKKQFLTTGINGLVEGAEFLGIEIGDNDEYREYVESILKPIYEADKKDRTGELMWNLEMVPAENLGVKNAKWDRKDGYFVPRDCYNSYFYKVEDENVSPMEKFILHGKKFTKYCDGGSALHCNLKEHLSKEQYRFLLKYAIKQGTPYFTFNVPNTVCNKCGHISKHYLDNCPRCGSDDLDYATRVIGYLTRVSKWSIERQEEFKRRANA